MESMMSQFRESEPSGGQALTVFVVDDDDAMRRGLEFLISSAGYKVEAFESAQAFLDHYRGPKGGCLLSDVRMPGMDGLQLLDHMRQRSIRIPVIFVTAFGNIPMAVRALQTGAFDFIEKPFDGTDLLARVRNALAQAKESPVRQQDSDEIRERLQSLTPREREVMNLVVAGKLNKQIAAELGINIKTVESHRARVMEKTRAQSLAELVRLAIAAGDDSPLRAN
jgi:two-component system, LuxR family, response regulator FixJ